MLYQPRLQKQYSRGTTATIYIPPLSIDTVEGCTLDASSRHVYACMGCSVRERGDAVMRRGRGSMREYVQRDNLEPRARCGRVLARQAGGAATRVAQPPQPHNPSSSQHTATAHPHRLLGSASNSVEISSIGGTTGPQQIGALRFLDPQQSHKTFTSGFKAPTARTGIPASNKQLPKFSLVQAGQPFKLERRPMSRAVSPGPRAKYKDRATTADRLIGVP